MNLNNFFGDMTESILDPIQKDMSKEIWQSNKKLKTSVKKYILGHLEEWFKLYTEKKPTDVVLAGSITGYQYTSYSDIDVNVVIDLDDANIKRISKLLPNGNMLPGTKHPVNYYVTNKHQLKKAGSIYDILHSKWINEPEKKDVNIHYKAVLEITMSWMRKIDLDINELHRDVIEFKLYSDYISDQKGLEIDVDEIKDYLSVKESEIKADIDVVSITLHMIKQFRKEAFSDKDFKSDFLTQVDATNSNYSINNLVYKTLERFGYLEKLHKYAGMEFKDALSLK